MKSFFDKAISTKKKKQAAVITANGIGDGLIMMIASNHLKKMGYEITVFNPHLFSFENWFKGFSFKNFDVIEDQIDRFDLILLQHDNTQKAKHLVFLREKQNIPLYVFYTNHRENKHGVLDPAVDFAFDEDQTMIKNVLKGLKTFFPSFSVNSDNGLNIPKGLKHKAFQKRIILHPTSQSQGKNWPAKKFVKLALKLKKKGFIPTIAVSFSERPDWEFVIRHGIELPILKTLSDLCFLLYESVYFIGNNSGPAHLASCLHIPAVVLAKRPRNMRLWRPDWLPAKVICPSSWIINLKFLRLREKTWKKTITVNRVYKEIKNYI